MKKGNRLSLVLKSGICSIFLLLVIFLIGCGGESAVNTNKVHEIAEEDDASADSVHVSSDSMMEQEKSSSSSKKRKSYQDDEDDDEFDGNSGDDSETEKKVDRSEDDSETGKNVSSSDEGGSFEYTSVARPTKHTPCGMVHYTDQMSLPLRTWGYFGYVLSLRVSSTATQSLYLAFETEKTKINGPVDWEKYGVILTQYDSKTTSWIQGTEIYSANRASAAPLDGGEYSTVYTNGKFEKFEFDIESTWLEEFAGKNVEVVVTFYAPGIMSDSSGFGLDYYAIPETHPSLLYSFDEKECSLYDVVSSGSSASEELPTSSSSSLDSDDLTSLLKGGNWIWNGVALESKVNTGYSEGGIWFPYSDQDGGGSSYFDWNVPFVQDWANGVRDVSYVSDLVQSCQAICGEAHLMNGKSESMYAGIGFDLVSSMKIGVDISSCGGFEVVYTSDADITMGLEEENRANYGYDDYRATLKATTKPKRVTLRWSAYSQRGYESTAQDLDEMLKNIVMIDFQYIASSSFDSKFKIYALGTINASCLR